MPVFSTLEQQHSNIIMHIHDSKKQFAGSLAATNLMLVTFSNFYLLLTISFLVLLYCMIKPKVVPLNFVSGKILLTDGGRRGDFFSFTFFMCCRLVHHSVGGFYYDTVYVVVLLLYYTYVKINSYYNHGRVGSGRPRVGPSQNSWPLTLRGPGQLTKALARPWPL
jgi:hypothetical protein